MAITRLATRTGARVLKGLVKKGREGAKKAVKKAGAKAKQAGKTLASDTKKLEASVRRVASGKKRGAAKKEFADKRLKTVEDRIKRRLGKMEEAGSRAKTYRRMSKDYLERLFTQNEPGRKFSREMAGKYHGKARQIESRVRKNKPGLKYDMKKARAEHARFLKKHSSKQRAAKRNIAKVAGPVALGVGGGEAARAYRRRRKK